MREAKSIPKTKIYLNATEKRLKAEVQKLGKVAEELVKQRDAAEATNRAKSSFMADMSHEFRTPLI